MTTDGCPFFEQKLSLACYVFNTGNYKSLPSFLDNKSKGNIPFSIANSGNLDCLNIGSEPIKAIPEAAKCINCMFCVFGCPGHRFTVKESLEIVSHCDSSILQSDWGPLPELVEKSFKGVLLTEEEFQSGSFFNPIGKYQGFDDFTAIDETKNISVWLGNTIKFLLGSESRIGLEIPIDITGASRDGRLDVAGIINDYLIVCETKTTFRDLMTDKRFVEQISGYDSIISMEAKNRNFRYNQFLVIGGHEKDLLPPNDSYESSKVGNDSEKFYGLLKSYGIKFISAKAFLLMGMNKLINPTKFNLENQINSFFTENVVGLVTSGKIKY